MKLLGILLIVVGLIGTYLSTIAVGDIGLSFLYSGVVAILCGIGFMRAQRKQKG